MDAAVQQYLDDKQCFKIAKKELLLKIDRLLHQIMPQDVLLTVMNSMSLIGEYVNMERKRNESCGKCFNLNVELLKSQIMHNDLLKREAHIDYLKYTQEHADILQGIVEQAKEKQPLDNALDFSCCPDYSLVFGLFLVVAAPRAVDLTDSAVSTSIDQDTLSTSIPSIQDQEHSLIISQGFEESSKTPHFHNDSLLESLQDDSTSQGSSSNMRIIHTPFESLGRWTKDHPIVYVIDDPSRSVSIRKQLQTDAMWCYFDAFLTFVKPKCYT
nr:hypothetical protein [Tanacetum cinerariifolium]